MSNKLNSLWIQTIIAPPRGRYQYPVAKQPDNKTALSNTFTCSQRGYY